MKKIKTVGSITDFVRNDPTEKEKWPKKLAAHYRKHEKTYNIAGLSIVLILTGGLDFAFAEDLVVPASRYETGGIDDLAEPIYKEILGIGKWVIICKGALSSMKAVGDGDVEVAKKSFLAHVMIFLILLAYPYAMDKVEGLFASMRS